MGELIKISCKLCGYEKTVEKGSGMMGANLGMINKVLAEQQRVEFNKEYNAKQVNNYVMIQELYQCTHCKEIVSVPVLHYSLIDKTEKKVVGNCPQCKNNKFLIAGANNCPKCGTNVEESMAGYWD